MWTIPVRPHLAIVATLQLDQAALPVPQLAGFTKDLGNIQDSTPCIGDWEFEMTPSLRMLCAIFPTSGATTKKEKCKAGGWFNPIIQVPVVRAKFPPPMEWRGCRHLAPHLQAARTANKHVVTGWPRRQSLIGAMKRFPSKHGKRKLVSSAPTSAQPS